MRVRRVRRCAPTGPLVVVDDPTLAPGETRELHGTLIVGVGPSLEDRVAWERENGRPFAEYVAKWEADHREAIVIRRGTSVDGQNRPVMDA